MATKSAVTVWRNAWIIGASTGIGRQLALDISPLCGKVYVSARSQDKLNELAASVKNINAAALDVTDKKRVDIVTNNIDKNSQPIDIVVISSGMWEQIKLPALDPEVFQNAMDVNFIGVINVINAVAPKMAARGKGHIAIVASVSGYRGLPNAAAYAPTKAALINLAECIQPQFANMGITISIINPGFVETPMTSVNKFPMPFLMKVEDASQRIIKGLLAKKYEIAFPWQLALPLKLMRIFPNRLFFWMVQKFVLKK